MNDKIRIYNKKLIDSCVSSLLPSNVLFAMGDSYKIECASHWIKTLEQENENLKLALKTTQEAYDILSEFINEENK